MKATRHEMHVSMEQVRDEEQKKMYGTRHEHHKKMQ